MPTARKPKNLRISPAADTLIRALADKLGLSQTSVMELAIRKLAEAEGVKLDTGEKRSDEAV